MLSAVLFLALAPQHGCSRCQQQGVLACKAHVEVTLAQEERTAANGLEFCSWFASCTQCRGTGFVDCPRCDDGRRTAEVAARAAEIAQWMQPNALERALGRSVGRVQTRHHEIVVEVPLLPEGKKKVTAHALAHRLAGDLEHIAAKIAEHYAMQPEDYRARMRMWLWDDLAGHRMAMERFLGTVSTGDFKLVGLDPVFSVWDEPGLFDTVPGVRALFAHNTAHMLLSNAFEPTWVGDIGGGWFDAGLGHWYEYELFGRTVNTCREEASLNENYEDGQWRAAVRRRLEHEKDPLLPGLLPQHTGHMSAAEHALCWSIYDWLVTAHPGKVRPILAALKKKVPARQIFAQELERNVLELEVDWRAWVASTYPVRGDEPRRTADVDKRKR